MYLVFDPRDGVLWHHKRMSDRSASVKSNFTDCAHRSTDIPVVMPSTSTTAAAGVAVLRGERLLMVRQQRASGMRWEVPSGGQEAGETLEEAAAREAAEETGAGVKLAGVLCTYSSYRPQDGSVVLGAIYRGRLLDDDVVPRPQLDDGIVAADFVDPWSLPGNEVGSLTRLLLQRWWPQRHGEVTPFHIELWRTSNGYSRLDSATGELLPVRDTFGGQR